MILFSDNKQNAVKLTHRSQIEHALLVKIKENSKSNKQIPPKKVFCSYCIIY